jgi:hypothetical protein
MWMKFELSAERSPQKWTPPHVERQTVETIGVRAVSEGWKQA